MKKLAAFYFSGTGNTRYVTEELCKRLAAGFETKVYDIAGAGSMSERIGRADCVLLAFPIYGSSPPVPMRRFVSANGEALRGKEVVIVVTQYMFSGDGAASLGRAVERCGARVTYAEHFNMPNNLSDFKMFKIRNGSELTKTLENAQKRMDAFAERILGGKGRRRGFNPISHAVGYCAQRALWRKNESQKKSRLKIDGIKCIGCGLCAKSCPVRNITVEGGKAVPRGECALCYRCVNLCPRRAITLLGKEPPAVQYKGPRS